MSLLNDIRQGDPVAMAEIYEEMRPKLVNWITSQIRDRQLAEDLVNEAFIKLLHRHKSIYGQDKLQLIKWLYTTTYRELLTLVRRRKLIQEELGEVPELQDVDPAHTIIELDEWHKLNQFLLELTEKQYMVIRMRWAGFSRGEIARELDISNLAVNQLHMRAKKNLRWLSNGP